MIESARHRIHLENYIIRDDAAGATFADRLIERARSGVTVRVLYDWIGSFSTSRRFWRRLRDAGIEVRGFGPISATDPLLVFSRDHRKLLVVDGDRAVTGGLCIGDEWLGDKAKERQPWRDTAVAVCGPAARQLDQAFWRCWTFTTHEPASSNPDGYVEPASCGDVDVRVVATEPGRERGFRTIDLLLGVSARKIWVTEAYLSAPQRMYQAFKDAARDGADVRLLLPGSSDIRAVRNVSRVGYRGLLRSGVRIWEWNGPMLHAKTIVADGHWVRIGSSNLNPSSLLANWELDVFLHDRDIAAQMEQRFLADLDRSNEVLLRAAADSDGHGAGGVSGAVSPGACRPRWPASPALVPGTAHPRHHSSRQHPARSPGGHFWPTGPPAPYRLDPVRLLSQADGMESLPASRASPASPCWSGPSATGPAARLNVPLAGCV